MLKPWAERPRLLKLSAPVCGAPCGEPTTWRKVCVLYSSVATWSPKASIAVLAQSRQAGHRCVSNVCTSKPRSAGSCGATSGVKFKNTFPKHRKVAAATCTTKTHTNGERHRRKPPVRERAKIKLLARRSRQFPRQTSKVACLKSLGRLKPRGPPRGAGIGLSRRARAPAPAAAAPRHGLLPRRRCPRPPRLGRRPKAPAPA